MGKRIRHLEYYGFNDQNAYIGLPNVDLSDIREVNKQQDREIDEISGATKDKASQASLDELSGKVETFIDKQAIINKCLAKGINANKVRIEHLESRDSEIVDKINEVVDKFDPVYTEIGNISSSVDAVDAKLTQHLSETSDFEEKTNARLASLESGKMDKIEAIDIFVNKDDVYTKQEVDEKVAHISEGVATEEWVLKKGYISEADADGKYASKARLNALEDRVGDVQTNLYTQYNKLNSDLSSFKTTTNTKVDTLYDKIDTLGAKHDREISNIKEDVNEASEDIKKNSNDIHQINNVALPNKADKADFDNLSSRVNDLSNSLDGKVDKATYETDKARFGVQLDSLDNKKADKSALNALSGAVGGFTSEIEAERQARIAGDNALDAKIADTNNSIADIREENLGRDKKISDLERDLTKEINDRVLADNALIGTPNDKDEDITIYGAKKYADKVANNVLANAKTYTDIKDSSVRDYIDETKADLERIITAKADKAYVNAVKDEIEASMDDKVAAETNRAMTVESALEAELRKETLRAVDKENTISTALTHTSNIVKALTDWDGDDRADYTDIGNGIIDVMHREMHTINNAMDTSFFSRVEYHSYDKKISFYAKNGEEIGVLDVTEFSQVVIEKTWYENGIIYMQFTNGDVVEIDVKKLIDETEFSDGLQVKDGIVSVLKDPSSEEYLTVSKEGVKVSGIDAKLSAVTADIESLIRLIEGEKDRAMAAEKALNDRIDNLVLDGGLYAV